jgi:hypothetical protein
MKLSDLLEHCRISSGKKFKLKDHDPSWAGDKDVAKDERKSLAEKLLSEDTAQLAEAQDVLQEPLVVGQVGNEPRLRELQAHAAELRRRPVEHRAVAFRFESAAAVEAVEGLFEVGRSE